MFSSPRLLRLSLSIVGTMQMFSSSCENTQTCARSLSIWQCNCCLSMKMHFWSVSFCISTTAEEPKSLKCIWTKTCIYFHSNESGCKTQTTPRPLGETPIRDYVPGLKRCFLTQNKSHVSPPQPSLRPAQSPNLLQQQHQNT